jgi:release factor glutamine methyltransferase
MVYQPAEDTYLTLGALEGAAGDICVDVGSGSCALAAALAGKCRQVVAIDVDANACKSCPDHVDVVCGNALDAVRRADTVVSNPPYLPPEEPLDPAVHDTGMIQRLLRWVSAERPRTVIITFSSLGRADLIIDALKAQCVIVRAAALHMFFESIFTVTAHCRRDPQSSSRQTAFLALAESVAASQNCIV